MTKSKNERKFLARMDMKRLREATAQKAVKPVVAQVTVRTVCQNRPTWQECADKGYC